MWKKDEDQGQQPTPAPAASVTRPQPAIAQVKNTGFATIGPSIVIRGEVTGDEDLLIQGQVDGSVSLGLHSVTIGNGGRVKAGITGRVITVEGAVEGDLSAEEQIVLRGTARVKGDLNAPRVILEDGATFRGLVDMGTTPDIDSPSNSSVSVAASAKEDPATGAKRDAKGTGPGSPAKSPERSGGAPAAVKPTLG